MSLAISYALAPIGWHGFQSFFGNFRGGDAAWLLIAFLLAIVALSAFAAEVTLVLHASHRLRSRARWPLDFSESTARESLSRVNPVGSGMRT
jgi:hypothetical protein